MVTTGFYRLGCANVEQNVGKKERRGARMSLLPYIQAGEDVRHHERRMALLADEAIVMKDVPGWVVGESVYNTKNKKHWMPPTRFCHPKQW
ncbi:GRIM-19 [Pelagophyceae sp. CCMP2097]|nr:GRIM-19 [Pelagophyceae sp. CCMP2097]